MTESSESQPAPPIALPPAAQVPPGSAPLPSGESSLNQFTRGFRVPWEGWAFLRKHPELWRYVWWPTAVNLVIGGVIAGGLLALLVFNAMQLWSWGESGWGWGVAAVLLWLVLAVLASVAASALWYALSGILGGYLLSLLAERVERLLGTDPREMREVSWWHQVVDTTLNLGLLLLTNVGCLLLHLVPLAGSALALVVSTYFNGMILGTDLLELPLALRGRRRPEVRAFAARHRPYTLGAGVAVMVINLIPVVGALLLTTAVIGTVLLLREIEDPISEFDRQAGEKSV